MSYGAPVSAYNPAVSGYALPVPVQPGLSGKAQRILETARSVNGLAAQVRNLTVPPGLGQAKDIGKIPEARPDHLVFTLEEIEGVLDEAVRSLNEAINGH